jgi:hypothetical protein
MTEPAFHETPSWPPLPVGTALRVVKVNPEGEAVTEYVGTVIEAEVPAPWIAVEAVWTHRRYDLNGLLFLPGDTLHEFFSPVDWFNAFAVFAPDGTLRGWYANVTYPTRLDTTTDPYSLYWQDLYLDVVGLPDGQVFVRDEDELAASDLSDTDPELVARIHSARDELLRRCAAKSFPFHDRPED